MIPTNTASNTASARVSSSAAVYDKGREPASSAIRLPSDRRLLEDVAPVLQKLLESLVCQRVVEEHVQNLEGHGADVGAGRGGIDHMSGGAQLSRQDLRLETVVFIDVGDAADQV